MQNIMHGLEATNILPAISAANTAAATSGWIDVRGLVGLFGVLCECGVLTGTLDYTFQDADSAGGANPAAITPDEGTAVQVTTANDNPNTQLFLFDANKPRGWLQVIGTIVTGPAVVSYTLIALPKNSV